MKEKSKNTFMEFRFRLKEIAQIIFAIIFAILILSMISALLYHRFSSTGLYRTKYEGKIVDKSVTFRETEFGSAITRKLLIEDKSGFRSEIVVGANIYERAQAGGQIKSDGSGVIILPSETSLSDSNE